MFRVWFVVCPPRPTLFSLVSGHKRPAMVVRCPDGATNPALTIRRSSHYLAPGGRPAWPSINAIARHALDVATRRGTRWLNRLAPSLPVAGAAAELPAVFGDYLAALHEARTLCLADMPPGARTVLSVGASGAWYFDWFARAYGEVDRHIGVEAFLSEPAELPDNVEWVAADLAGPDGVATVDSGSVDLVFSGQNIEHLWPEQVVALLAESNRVLRPQGWLVVDSPNRNLTEAYRWTMEEHTVELVPEEAARLLELAGFEVVTMKGLWLCRQDGELLELQPPGTVVGASEVLERMMKAARRPADSFVWWAEARKVAEPDVAGLEREVRAVFADHSKERVGRMRSNEGTPCTLADGRAGVSLEKGSSGYLFFGPYLPLRAGRYELAVELEWADCYDHDRPLGILEVVARDGPQGEALVLPSGTAGRTVVRYTLDLETLHFGVQARLRSTGTARLSAPLSLSVAPDPYQSR
jgi:SAM-dependent methyltransferase